MSNSATRQALSLPPLPVDAAFIAKVASFQESGDGGPAALQGLAISPGSATVVPGVFGGTINSVVFDLDAGFQVLSITGTNSLPQLLAELAGSGLVPFPGLPGRCSAWTAIDASFVIASGFQLLSPNKPTVFMGHSLGGAVAAVVALYAANRGYPVQSVITIGSPKPGDVVLASALSTLPYYRLETAGDLVPSIPQPLPMPLPGNILQFIPADWALYAHGGTVSTLYPDGTWQTAHHEMTALEVVATLLAQAQTQHYAATYFAYAKAGFAEWFNLVPFAWGYEKPWRLLDQDEQPHVGNAVDIGSIPVPGNFTNTFAFKVRQADGSVVTWSTLDDPPPPNWVPSLAPIPKGNEGCDCWGRPPGSA